MQVLWLDPSIARGVLAHLSALQAAEQSIFHDSEPGKIVHEMRKGEMAALREVPFGRYYGGVDTTPLFVMLAGAYLKRTNDESFARDLWPAVRAALDWMENFGDADRDGFIEYRRGAESGLSNQGWKDSHDRSFMPMATWREARLPSWRCRPMPSRKPCSGANCSDCWRDEPR